MTSGAELFARHLDLEPLRGRRRGVVRCIFHEERTPSLSVDLDRGLFHCFGCGVQGGGQRFAELVGEPLRRLPRKQPRPETEAARGAREVLDTAQRAVARLAEWRPLLGIVGWAWAARATIQQIRAVCTELGENERTIAALAQAARLETLTEWAESELEAVLESGRAA